MNSRDAERFLNGLALRPGWKLEAVHTTAEEVWLLLSVRTASSNEADAPYYWRDFERMCEPVKIITTGKDETALVGELLTAIAEIEMHEHREFTRYRDRHGRWIAPFHPHRDEGESAMARHRPFAGARSI